MSVYNLKYIIITYFQFGNSPLLAAIMGGHTDTAKLLISCGADVGKCDKVSVQFNKNKII